MSAAVDELSSHDADPLTATERRNLHTMDLVEASWNNGDVAAILTHYDDEIAWRNVATGESYRGKHQVGAFLTALFDAVPDLSMRITRRIARGDLVAEEYTIGGTHRGNLLGIPATGRAVEINAVSFVRMRDGRFLADNFYFDVSGVLAQLGLFPPLTVAQTPVGHALMGVVVFLRSPRRWVRTRRSAQRVTASR